MVWITLQHSLEWKKKNEGSKHCTLCPRENESVHSLENIKTFFFPRNLYTVVRNFAKFPL